MYIYVIKKRKIIDGNTTVFYNVGGVKAGEYRDDGIDILYLYDDKGDVYGISVNTHYYYFMENVQGDVIGLYNFDGKVCARYTYDSWGKIISVQELDGRTFGEDNKKIGEVNPFRYRGYYYDTETGFYYLNSRYYDPQFKRFINPDAIEIIIGTSKDLTDKNLCAYCDNNPIIRNDTSGEFWDTFFDIASLVASVVDVVCNPTDPMAWAGLAADVICTITPCLTGGGTVVRAVSKADDAVDAVKTIDKVDTYIDSSKVVRKGWHVGDDITLNTAAGNTPSWTTVRNRYWKNEAHYNSINYNSNDLERMRKGRAPMGPDQHPFELHHTYGRNGENFLSSKK